MGNGVDFMMGTHKWHGVAPNDEQLKLALDQNPETIGDYQMKKFINQGNNDTRSGFGAGLLEIGRKNKNIVALCLSLIHI